MRPVPSRHCQPLALRKRKRRRKFRVGGSLALEATEEAMKVKETFLT